MRTYPLLLLLAAGCSGGPEEIEAPLHRVAILPPEGDLLAPEETAELTRALADLLRSRGFEVSESAAALRGDPWTWDRDLRRKQGVDGFLRTRLVAFERPRGSVAGEAQLVEAESGRTRYWKEGQVRPKSGSPLRAWAVALLSGAPGASAGSGGPAAAVEPPRPEPPAASSLTPTWPVDEAFELRLGGNLFSECPVPYQYAGWPLLTLGRLPDGTLGVDLDLHDAAGGLLARVRSNRLIGREAARFVTTRTEDRWALLERGTGDVLCALRRLDADKLEGAFKLRAPDGSLWEATADKMDLRPMVIKENVFRKCKVGVVIGRR
jgi:hypothetical protein